MSASLKEAVEREMRAVANDTASACKCIPEDSIGPNGNVPLLCVPCAVEVAVRMLNAQQAIYEAHAETWHGCKGIKTCGQGDSGLTTEQVFGAEQREWWGHAQNCDCHTAPGTDGDWRKCHPHGYHDPRCAPQPGGEEPRHEG